METCRYDINDQAIADMVRILGNVNSRVVTTEYEITKLEKAVLSLLKEVRTLQAHHHK